MIFEGSRLDCESAKMCLCHRQRRKAAKASAKDGWVFWRYQGLSGRRVAEGWVSRYQAQPKSSPKRIAAKKARESPLPRLSFPARLLRIHALRVKKHHNPLIWRHLPKPASYSAVFQNALAGAP